MTFAEVIAELERVGTHARRRSWPLWRLIYVARESSEITQGALVVTLEKKHPDAALSSGQPDYLLRWGLARWRPLYHDLTAADWEIIA